MMLGNSEKGNAAEYAICAELVHLGAYVTRINQQDDGLHGDIQVTLRRPVARFQVQCKFLSEPNRSLRVQHLRDWVSALDHPTVPLWWDDEKRIAYWADPVKFLLRTGGMSARANAKFNERRDLRLLDARDQGSRDRFVKRIRDLCLIWPHMRSVAGLWLANVEFPVNFVDVVENPEILMYLPSSSRLVALLSQFSAAPRSGISQDVLLAARLALSSPQEATKRLLHKYGVRDPQIYEYVENCFLDWCERIPAHRRWAVAQTLWGYDRILAIAGYQRPGDLHFRRFSASRTYPIGNLVSLFPSSLFLEPLSRMLTQDNDRRVLQFAAWCTGIMNHPVHSEYGRDINKLRLALPSRAEKIGEGWPLVDRQLLYTEVQLGGDEARSEFLRKLSIGGVGEFEAAYNLAYYEGDRDLIRYRFERRLHEGFKTDRNVSQIISGIYHHIHTRMGTEMKGALALRPKLWQEN